MSTSLPDSKRRRKNPTTAQKTPILPYRGAQGGLEEKSIAQTAEKGDWRLRVGGSNLQSKEGRTMHDEKLNLDRGGRFQSSILNLQSSIERAGRWKSGSWIDGFGGFSICNLQWRQSSITRPSELHRFATRTRPGCHRKTTILPPEYHRFRHAGDGLRMPDLPFYQGVVREEPGVGNRDRRAEKGEARAGDMRDVKESGSPIFNPQSAMETIANQKISASPRLRLPALLYFRKRGENHQ